jgi:hypothetical protein
VYTDIILGEEEIDNFVLIAGSVLLDKLEYTVLGLAGYLTWASLHTGVRRRHCSKALQVAIQSTDPWLGYFELLSDLQALHACA